MAVIRKKGKKAKRDTNFATWKFELENTINADPRLGPACLCVTRVYLDWMGSPSATPFLSTPAIAIASSLSENTVRQARRDMEKEGYFILVGKTSSGVPMYKIVNAGLNRVLDHLTIARERLKEIEAEKKSAFRRRRSNAPLSPSNSAGDMSPSNSAGQKGGVPFKNCGDSPSESEPNNVYYSVDSIINEEGRDTFTPWTDAPSYSLARSGDEANAPLPIPDTLDQADLMIEAICDGFDVMPSIEERMKDMLLSGILTPRLAEVMRGRRREAA